MTHLYIPRGLSFTSPPGALIKNPPPRYSDSIGTNVVYHRVAFGPKQPPPPIHTGQRPGEIPGGQHQVTEDMRIKFRVLLWARAAMITTACVTSGMSSPGRRSRSQPRGKGPGGERFHRRPYTPFFTPTAVSTGAGRERDAQEGFAPSCARTPSRDRELQASANAWTSARLCSALLNNRSPLS